MMKRKIIFHIGLPKTATSSLQHFFHKNANLLQEDFNILYPKSGRTKSCPSSHFRLFFSFQNKDHFLCPKDIGSPEFEMNLILNESKYMSDQILISCEYLIFLSINEFMKLKKIINDRYEIKFIIYLRRIDDHIISLTNQKVKSNILSNKKINLSNTIKMRVDIYKKIEKLTKIFGVNNIIYRIYDYDKFFENNINKDFLVNALQITDFSRFAFPEKEINIKLGKNSFEYKLLVNKLGYLPLQIKKISDLLVDYSINHENSSPILLTYNQRKELFYTIQKYEEHLFKLFHPEETFEYLFSPPEKDFSSQGDINYQISLEKSLEISKYLLQKLMFLNIADFDQIIIKNIKSSKSSSKYKKQEVIESLVKNVVGLIIEYENHHALG